MLSLVRTTMISCGMMISGSGEMKMFSCARLKFRVSHTNIYPEPGTLLESTAVLQLIP